MSFFTSKRKNKETASGNGPNPTAGQSSSSAAAQAASPVTNKGLQQQQQQLYTPQPSAKAPNGILTNGHYQQPQQPTMYLAGGTDSQQGLYNSANSSNTGNSAFGNSSSSSISANQPSYAPGQAQQPTGSFNPQQNARADASTAPPFGAASAARANLTGQPFAGIVSAAPQQPGNGYQQSPRLNMSNGSSTGYQQSPQSAQQQPASSTVPNGTASGPGNTPVTYPWSQRQIKLVSQQKLISAGNSTVPPQDVPTVSPFPRYGHSANPAIASATGDVYIFGGLVREQVRNDLYLVTCGTVTGPNGQSTPSSDSKALAASPVSIAAVETRGEVPCPRVGHAAVSVGNVLVIWGGDTKTREEDQQDDKLYLLNLGSRDWTLVKTVGAVPQGRYGHAAAMRSSKFYIFAGQQDVPPGLPDDAAFLNDLWCFDLQGLKAGKPYWHKIEYAPDSPVPAKRTGHTMVTYGDSLYIFGGTDGQYHYNDTWCFNTHTHTWNELSCIGYIPVPREGHAATLVDDVIYVFGGRSVDGKDLEDLAAFKISNQRWYMFTNMGPAPSGRSGHAMATWQNKVFVVGGESYTSDKHSWPDMIHMLDTNKIKYPSEARLGNRKSSHSKMATAPTTNVALPSPMTNTAPVLQERNVTSPFSERSGTPVGLEEQLRATSPVNASNVRSKLSGPSAPPIDAVVTQFPPPEAQSANAGTGKDMRPLAMDAVMRAKSPIDEQAVSTATRALSPTEETGRTAALPGITNTPSGDTSTAAIRSHSAMSSTVLSTVPNTSITALRANARSPTPDQYGYGQINALPSQRITQDAAAAENAKRAVHREKWLRAALQAAVDKGFELPAQMEGLESLTFESATENRQLIDALLAARRELTELKSSLGSNANAAEQRIQLVNNGRLAALQEATFYRVKIAALENGTSSDISKLDQRRIAELEGKIADMGAAKAEMERSLHEARSELEHHRGSAQSASEREVASSERAEAAEASYSRALADFADLQRRAHQHESTVQDQTSHITTLESQLQQVTLQHKHISNKLATAEGSLEQHLRTLEQTHATLVSANAQAKEMESLWLSTKEELEVHRQRAIQSENDLQRVHQQIGIIQTEKQDMERALVSSQTEAESLRHLASGHLSDLLESSREIQTRDLSYSDTHAEQLDAIQQECKAHQRLAKDAQSRATAVQTELRDSRAQQISLEKQVALLRSELAGLRTRHASALESASRSQTLVAQRDLDLRERARSLEAVEVRAGLLRNLLSENGLNADDNGSPSLGSSESGNSLKRKVADLEARLEQRTQSLQDLQNVHEQSKQQAEAARHRARVSQEQIDELSSRIEQLKIAASSGGASEDALARAQTAQTALTTMQDKYAQLESTHLKAVQYVKGTEKMMRRMKDELVKYKERNEALENELASKSPTESTHSRTMSAELRPELDGLRSQLIELRKSSEASSSHNEELQQKMKKLQAEYDQTLSRHKTDSSDRIAECEADIEHLSIELEKARTRVSETLAINKQLNEKLQTLKTSRTPAEGHKADPSEPWHDTEDSLEKDIASSAGRMEWLKRENAALEQRCQEAESKITLLLDHIESSGGVEAVSSSIGHSNEHVDRETARWKAGSRSDSRSDAGSDYSLSGKRESQTLDHVAPEPSTTHRTRPT